MQKPILIKVSGHEISDPEFLGEFADVIKAIDQPVLIVHGGGAEISRMQERLGLTPRYVNGLRVTDAETLEMVEMVLCGVVNKRLVRYLVNVGVNALGLSGVDQGILRAKQLAPEMEYTGEVTNVRGDIIGSWLLEGVVPVIAPVCIGDESNFNVNADSVASAIAIAIGVDRTIFISNVEGVLVNGQVETQLTVSQAKQLIEDGTVFGGMIPKVQAVIDIIDSGVPQVVITNLNGLKTHGGTVFVRDSIHIR